MKILAVGDTHGDSNLMKELATRAVKENVDLVLLCGDITMFDNVQRDTIKPFKQAGKKVLLIPGNHEQPATIDYLSEIYGSKNIHDGYVIYENTAFIGNSSVNVGPHGILTDEEVFKSLQTNTAKIKNLKTVFVTHVHPSGTRADSMSHMKGSHGLRKAIDELQPDIVIHGHCHEAQGLEEQIGKTRVINVAKKARVIEL
ncbi:metallophosphoesterase [Candidatus Woesearchaeota archaeon]|nr:metallophosphoesterase [Candidatus Woesearchaeota archaeon]